MKTYKESQKFGRTIIFILIPICILVCGIAIWQVGFGNKVGNHPAPDFVNILIAGFVCLLTIAFWGARLQTEITEEGIKYGFRFILSYGGIIAWSDIKQVRFMKYPYIGEGIRLYSEINGWAYVTESDDRVGMLIESKDGKKNVLISTQQLIELKQSVKAIAPNGVEIIED